MHLKKKYGSTYTQIEKDFRELKIYKVKTILKRQYGSNTYLKVLNIWKSFKSY